eukprot:877635_1
MVNYIKTDAEFQELMEKSKEKLVVIDFTASWCGPCRMIAPVFEQMAVDNPTVIFIKIDVDDADQLAAKCGVSAMPTFMFYKDGKKIEEFKGANQNALKAAVAKHA